MRKRRPTALALALRAFFSEHMPHTRGLSPHTVRSYRDAVMLLLRFLAVRLRCAVVELDLPQLTPVNVVAYLDDLEKHRGNGTATRNARLAAVHSFARFVAMRHPEQIESCQRLLAVPVKRSRSRAVEYLEGHEIRAMLDAVATDTTDGRRDYALILILFNTGARVQEILDVRPIDFQLEQPFHVRLMGKGRKERLCPLWPSTVGALRRFLASSGLDEHSAERLFRNHRGEPLTRFGVRYLLRKYAKLGSTSAPSLSRRRIHPHVLRHTSAVHMLQSGVDLVSISHWLGHANVETTNRYTTLDLEMKRAAVARADPLFEHRRQRRWRSDSSILEWLESL